MSVHPHPDLMARLSPESAAFMTSLRSHLTLADCRFSHGAPWWQADSPLEYYTQHAPHEPKLFAEQCARFAESVYFTGHFHAWQVVSTTDLLTWADEPISLPDSKHLVTIQAVKYEWCATYDTTTRTLTPIRIAR